MDKSLYNGDFVPYYCNTTKKHIWVLGYFGGGSINYKRFVEVAKDFSDTVGVDINTVCIDEIQNSRRFKYFKYLTSTKPNQIPVDGSVVRNNVFNWLYD